MIKLADLLKEASNSLKQRALEFLESRRNTYTWGSSNHKLVLKMIKDITNIQDDGEVLPYLQQYVAIQSHSLIKDPATGMLIADPSVPKIKTYPNAIKYMVSSLLKTLRSTQQ